MYLDADVIHTYNCFNLSTNSQDCKNHVQGRKKIWTAALKGEKGLKHQPRKSKRNIATKFAIRRQQY